MVQNTVKTVSLVVMVAIMLTIGTSAAFAASNTLVVDTHGSYAESGDANFTTAEQDGNVHNKGPSTGAELWKLYVKIKKEEQMQASTKSKNNVQLASVKSTTVITDDQMEVLVDYCSTDEFLESTYKMTRSELRILKDLFKEYAAKQKTAA